MIIVIQSIYSICLYFELEHLNGRVVILHNLSWQENKQIILMLGNAYFVVYTLEESLTPPTF